MNDARRAGRRADGPDPRGDGESARGRAARPRRAALRTAGAPRARFARRAAAVDGAAEALRRAAHRQQGDAAHPFVRRQPRRSPDAQAVNESRVRGRHRAGERAGHGPPQSRSAPSRRVWRGAAIPHRPALSRDPARGRRLVAARPQHREIGRRRAAARCGPARRALGRDSVRGRILVVFDRRRGGRRGARAAGRVLPRAGALLWRRRAGAWGEHRMHVRPERAARRARFAGAGPVQRCAGTGRRALQPHVGGRLCRPRAALPGARPAVRSPARRHGAR